MLLLYAALLLSVVVQHGLWTSVVHLSRVVCTPTLGSHPPLTPNEHGP